MKAARFTVAGDLLRQILHMPDTAVFVDARRNWMPGLGDSIEFTVVDDTLADTDDPAEAQPSVTTIAAIPERYEWHWNLP